MNEQSIKRLQLANEGFTSSQIDSFIDAEASSPPQRKYSIKVDPQSLADLESSLKRLKEVYGKGDKYKAYLDSLSPEQLEAQVKRQIKKGKLQYIYPSKLIWKSTPR